MNNQETCKKHGTVPIWVTCKHVAAGSADTVIFSEKQDVLCSEKVKEKEEVEKNFILGQPPRSGYGITHE